jgi:NitT/TauT family transport system substrate-binding protein
MNRSIVYRLTLFVVALLSLSVSATSSAESFKISHTTWVGYGPLYLARDLGFFEEEGVDVELIVMEETTLRTAALMGGQVEGSAGTADEYPLYMRGDSCLRYVLALDESAGGDGIVALKEIRSVSDLKGHKVAFNESSVSQFWLNVLLIEAGLSQNDIEMINMTATDAGTAFMAEQVDAAVTWEPHLTQGKNSEHGHLLIDSSASPGVIIDILVVRCDVAENRADDIKSIVRGWNRAVDYWRENPEKANAIMAKGVGGWLEDPAEFAATLTGVNFIDGDTNKAYFGSPSSPGPLYDTVQFAIDIWNGLEKLQTDIKPEDLITNEFLTQ